MYNQYNPYFNQQRPVTGQFDNQQQFIPYIPQNNLQQPKNSVIQGKVVDSLDVVKATEIPMDGSVSYFPLSDGSSIVTKQLQMDGTSKVTIYKPISNVEEKKEEIKFVTFEELENKLNNLNFPDYREEINNLQKEIKELKKSSK